jgi:uncharacterized protein (TIGR03118 family)
MFRLLLGAITTRHPRRNKSRHRKTSDQPAHRARLCLETLESRLVPSANDWAMPNYSPAGTRDNTAEHILGPNNVGNLQTLWEFPTGGIVAGTPAVVHNVVYAGDSLGDFYAVKSDGTLLWSLTGTNKLAGQITASPLVTQGVVIIGTDSTPGGDGFVYGLDAKTGAVDWKIHPNTSAHAAVWGSATQVGNNVAIGIATDEEFVTTAPVSRGSLVLLNPTNGQVIWQTYTVTDAELASGVTGSAIWSTPAYDPATGIIYAGTGNNYGNNPNRDNPTRTNGTSDAMIAFNAKTGAIIWVNQRTSNDNWNRQFPGGGPDADFGDSPHLYKLSNGEKVVGSGQKSGFFWVFDAKDGHVVNVTPSGKEGLQVSTGSSLGGLYATAAVDTKTDTVFANDRDPSTTPQSGHVVAIAGNGQSFVSTFANNGYFNTTTPDQSGVAIANGVVYFDTLGGTLFALDEKTGKVLAQVATDGANSGPSVSNGHIYVGQGNFLGGGAGGGGIMALGLKQAQTGDYLQTNLVSDIPGEAQVTDPNLKNPWGVSESTTSPFWVSDQATGKSTLYIVKNGTVTAAGLVVSIPTTQAGPQGPTGQVSTGQITTGPNDFLISTAVGGNGNKASFIFADLNGTIDAWNSGTTAIKVQTTAGAVYTGLAIGNTASGNFLYAANDAGRGSIDVFDSKFAPVTLGTGGFGTFRDPLLPTDLNLVPFNVEDIGGNIYVAYAPSGRPNQTGAVEGQGAVAIFDTTGHFVRQLIVGSELAAPWGMAMAPATFGKFGGDLLVGNFAYNVSEINAFNPTTGSFVGTVTSPTGTEFQNQALWYIGFGNGGNGGDKNTLYFAAGINAEKDGLFGQIQVVPTLAHNAPIVTNLANGVEQTFSTRSVFSTAPTVPNSGDQNPYGVAFVPPDIKSGGKLQPGDILVSNFNNGAANGGLQGTGTTIIRITPSGERSVFFQGKGLGLTTALGVLKSGFVLVGNVPTTDGKFATLGQGSLLVLDTNGNLVTTLTDPNLLRDPWDLTINDHGSRAQVFVSNVTNVTNASGVGNGVVTRIDLHISPTGALVVDHMTRIASGYKVEENDAALVVGPTGLAYDARRDILYVASTDDNAIYAIDDAGDRGTSNGKGKLIYQDSAHLHGPLALVLAPNGDLITANGDAVNSDPNQPSELVEFTPQGKFVGQFSIDPNPGGAFGIALANVDGELRFAAVNDNTNSLDVWTFATEPVHHRHHHH